MSRATDLQFRHPKEISDAIYNPDVSEIDLKVFFHLIVTPNIPLFFYNKTGDLHRQVALIRNHSCEL